MRSLLHVSTVENELNLFGEFGDLLETKQPCPVLFSTLMLDWVHTAFFQDTTKKILHGYRDTAAAVPWGTVEPS